MLSSSFCGSLCRLDNGKLDATVLLTPRLRGIVRYGLGDAESLRRKPRLVDAVVDQILHDGLRSLVREFHVSVRVALGAGMPLDENLRELRVVLEDLRYLVEQTKGNRQDRCLVMLELDLLVDLDLVAAHCHTRRGLSRDWCCGMPPHGEHLLTLECNRA